MHLPQAVQGGLVAAEGSHPVEPLGEGQFGAFAEAGTHVLGLVGIAAEGENFTALFAEEAQDIILLGVDGIFTAQYLGVDLNALAALPQQGEEGSSWGQRSTSNFRRMYRRG